MSVPTKGETFSQLIDHLRLAQEASAMLGHLSIANQEQKVGEAWLQVSELLKRTQKGVIDLATRGLQ
jgi:hypothetical protein